MMGLGDCGRNAVKASTSCRHEAGGASVYDSAYGILDGRLPTLGCPHTALFVVSTGTCRPTVGPRISRFSPHPAPRGSAASLGPYSKTKHGHRQHGDLLLHEYDSLHDNGTAERISLSREFKDRAHAP